MLRGLRAAILAAMAAFVIATSVKAILAPAHVEAFPEGLLVKAELIPLTFDVHMVSGGLALLLVPAAFLLRARPRWHRIVGRIAAAAVLVAGLTAFPVALTAPVTRVSAWGFAAQGTVWLALLAAGIAFIRRGDRARHRAAMLMMLAVTSGAVFFRIWLALWAIFAQGRHYQAFYAGNAWLAWLVPLAITAWLVKATGPRAGDAR